MIEDKDIEAARRAGVLDDAKATELQAFFRSRGDPGASMDTESLRFLANFNDIFLSVGLLILALGLIVGSGLFLGPSGSALVVAAPVLIALWALLEYFAGRRRLLLPSMTLSSLIVLIASLVAALIGSGLSEVNSAGINLLADGFQAVEGFGYWSTAGGIISAGAIYARFRMPFALFLVALSGAMLVYVTVNDLSRVNAAIGGGMMLSVGIVTLLAAVAFDMSDPQRLGLPSDNAFWLHLAAAPQVILGLRLLLVGSGVWSDNLMSATAMVAAVIAFAILSLALNRRALIASSLVSFWVAVSAIITQTSGGGTLAIVLTLLLIGGSVVLLGAGWKSARVFVLAFLPSAGIFARVFPPEPDGKP